MRAMLTGTARLPAVALVLALLAAPLHVRAAAADDLSEATDAWKSLNADARRRQQRHAWKRVIARLEKTGRALPGCGKGSLGLLRAARATEGLANISLVREDFAWAESLYRDAAEACPTGSLADDAFMDAARLAKDALKDPASARASAGRASALKGDRRKDAEALLATLPAGPDQLDAATESLESLKDDRKRRRLRHHWVTAIAKLEKAGAALAPSDRGALAYVRAAKASEELSRLSKHREDAEKAVALYLAAADRCPGASIVDDALVAAATLATHRLGQPDAARGMLERALALKGDASADARTLLSELPQVAPPPARVAVAAAPPPVVEASALVEKPVVAEPAAAETEELVVTEDAASLGELMARVETMAESTRRAEVAKSVKELSSTALGGEWSISEQVGLKVRRIVLDAGHGGHDTGAIGPTGVREKDVTLSIVKELAALLRGRGYEVVLTRDSDEFLALEERTAAANKAKGDLFVSVHANAHKSRTKTGVETYSLNVASDRFAMRLAARENATTERSVSDLQFLLADLAVRANTADSDRLARSIQDSIVTGVAKKHGKPKDLGVKHALFYVLLGARMPAVLVETEFLSNPGTEKKLASGAYQKSVATAIADGVGRFVERRSQLASAE